MGLPAFLHPLAVWRAATRWAAILVVITPPGGYRAVVARRRPSTPQGWTD